MSTDPYTLRAATAPDVPLLASLIVRSGIALSKGFYTAEQAQAITSHVFGVDSQLIADGTYYIVEDRNADPVVPVACGGWSRRRTLFGGDQTKRGADPLLDPATDAARIRAFFVEPSMARQGLGRRLIEHCSREAYRAGFRSLELAATMPGVPLYRDAGFTIADEFVITVGAGVEVPLATMRRPLAPLDGFAVVPTITAAHVLGYNRALDQIARERRYFGIVEGPPVATSQAFVDAAHIGRGVHLVALNVDDAVVGWCDIARHTRAGFEHCGRLGMGLLPEARGKGVGERLLRAVLREAKGQAFERVELEVFGSNTKAQALYQRLGFIEEGRKVGARKLDDVYDDDVLMVRWLVSPAPRGA